MTTTCVGDALLAGWRRAGVETGMHVIVHSALSSIGPVEGGPGQVLATLRTAVGPDGTLVAPAFTPQVADPHPEVRGVPDDDVRARREQVPLFTPGLPSPMGAVAETLRQAPGAMRSWHPQASVAALGARAEEIVSTQPLHFAVGEGSPFDALYKLGGFILLVGVGHNRNSFLHCRVSDCRATAQTASVPGTGPRGARVGRNPRCGRRRRYPLPGRRSRVRGARGHHLDASRPCASGTPAGPGLCALREPATCRAVEEGR